MGGRVGYEYEYDYRFSVVDADEIRSVYKLFPDPKLKSFLFEIRTNFILRRRSEEGVVTEGDSIIIIDSERYDSRVHGNEDGLALYFITYDRLDDYWMSDDKIELLSHKAFDFAKEMAVKPEHTIIDQIQACFIYK